MSSPTYFRLEYVFTHSRLKYTWDNEAKIETTLINKSIDFAVGAKGCEKEHELFTQIRVWCE